MSNEMINPNSDPSLPAFMRNEEIVGVDGLDRYIRPPRLKIVQAMSKEPFDQFDKGSVLLVPSMITVSPYDKVKKSGEPFKFVPLFWYTEWVQTNPLGKTPFIRERSFDPRSELAQKAMNRETWTEPHPEDPEVEVSNREHLNFIVMLYDNQLQGNPCVMTFAKGEFKTGGNFANLIKLRKASIFGQVFNAVVGEERKGPKGNWFGFDITVPAEDKDKWVTEEDYAVFKELHEQFREAHESGLIEVDYEDVPATASNDAESEF